MFLKELRNFVLFITRGRVIIILFSTSYIGLIFCLFFLKIGFIVFQCFLCFLSVLGFKFHAISKDLKPFYYSLRFYYYYYYHHYYYYYYYYYYFNFVSHFIKTSESLKWNKVLSLNLDLKIILNLQNGKFLSIIRLSFVYKSSEALPKHGKT